MFPPPSSPSLRTVQVLPGWASDPGSGDGDAVLTELITFRIWNMYVTRLRGYQSTEVSLENVGSACWFGLQPGEE